MVAVPRHSSQSPVTDRYPRSGQAASRLEIALARGSTARCLRIAQGERGRREEAMRGLMSEQPLLISRLIEHAARFHGDVEIVSRTVEGEIHRYTYADAQCRARQLAKALLRLGVQPGDRVGTLAWNTHPHFQLY